jgi:hypothetical protein
MINIDSDTKLTLKSTGIVEINKICSITGYHRIEVPYKIICDFNNIPPRNHEIVLLTLMTI